MTGKRVDVVLVKLCAVIVVVLSLRTFSEFAAFYVHTPEADFMAVTAFLLNFALPILIAAALWFFPATIIGRVSDDTSVLGSSVDVVLLSVSLIGLYVLVFGVIDLAYFESFRIAEQEALDPSRLGIYKPSPNIIAGRVTNIIQVVIGVVLLVGRRRITRIIGGRKAASEFVDQG